MDRKEQLLEIFKDKDITLIETVIEDVIFLEKSLNKLREMPFISVNPNNSAQQKATAASKQYKELLQQYNNCIKILIKFNGADEGDKESPLRKWVNERFNKK